MKGNIKIEDYKLHCLVGVYPHEKLKAQEISIALTLTCDFSKCVKSDALQDTIDYEQLVACLKKTALERHFHLLETLADRLLQALFEQFPIFDAQISLKNRRVKRLYCFGKVAMTILITGGAKSLGAQTALELASRGFSLCIHYRHSEKEALMLARRCADYGVYAVTLQGDFSTIEGVQDFICRYQKRCPETYGIINNVGNFLIKSVKETTLEEWLSLFQTNLHTPFLLIQALRASLKKNKGRVVNIGTSGIQTLRANTYATAYAMTKLSLYSLTLALAKELAPDEVTVNMVSPGFLESAVDLKDPGLLPMKRAGTVIEGAKLIAHFFSEECRYITGQNIELAGGFGL